MRKIKFNRLMVPIALGLTAVVALMWFWGVNPVSAQGCEYEDSLLVDNPIAYWRLNESTGRALNIGSLGDVVSGTYVGGVTRGVNGLIVGDPDLAAGFDGVYGYVAIPSHDAINTGGPYAARTIELWFRASAPLTDTQVLYEEGGDINGLNIFLNDNQLTVGAWADNAGQWISTTVTADTVYHVALVFSGTAQSVTGYLNGMSFGSASISFTEIPSHTGQIAIGAISYGTRYSNAISSTAVITDFFSGVIDEVALYNSALSAARIQAHAAGCYTGLCRYQTGPLADNTIAYWRLSESSGPADNLGSLGSPVDGTYENGVSRGVNGLIVGDPDLAAAFDGVDDYVAIPSNPALNTGGPYNAKTVELWFRASAPLTGTQVLYEQGGWTNGLNIFLNDNQLTVGVWAGGAGQWISTTVTTDTVYHVALVFSGTAQSVTGYLNSVNFGSASTSFTEIPTQTGQIAIGAISDGTRYSNAISSTAALTDHFSGVIDEVALYNTALSAARIRAHALGCSSPSLAVVKGGPASAGLGDTVVYTFTVTNTGNMTLRNLQVEDDVAGPGNRVGGDINGNNWLDLTEAWVYTAAYTVPVTISDRLTNTVTVTATDSLSITVTDTATHSLDVVFSPVLTVTKQGQATAGVGDTVVYTFTVRHDASSDGSPVSTLSVTDTVAGSASLNSGGDTNSNSRLDGGETWVYTASYTIQPADPNPLGNIGNATGRDIEGDTITASDSHSTALSGFAPDLEIEANWPASANVGSTIAYTFTIRHSAASDGSPVVNLSVSDTLVGPITRTGGDDGDGLLEAGENWIYPASYIVKVTDPDPLPNTVTATGQDQELDPVTKSANLGIPLRRLIFLPVILAP